MNRHHLAPTRFLLTDTKTSTSTIIEIPKVEEELLLGEDDVPSNNFTEIPKVELRGMSVNQLIKIVEIITQ